MYSKRTLQHFRSPHNYGEIKNADGVGEAGNIVCGDVMSLYLKMKKIGNKEPIIDQVKFKTYGCAAAIATSSAITDLVKGKTIEEALKISKNDIIEFLEGLPPIKIHCSILAIDALDEAIYQYLTDQKKPILTDLQVKHNRIKKGREQIEERYKKWMTKK
ncbi:iron-sulfur cluster assembly scaffold protein [Candidatus Roizmanbacteria bacterium CG_4_10_14_0_2_um_filter_36_35]|uniref:Iron-sulfur cluster assembly scaffold protein n=4 Tax=Candidatus Roizmaniibacteriota TaxID=1752723 RepID=A0A2M7BX70_9BACT|nr:MAG: iron-sulfur cluster assembly scaffold protein [Candidatus Roizmanbacteria bacterium CG11_big_fil_rev_8_21_14_0_20_35_14]PIV11120.1 MAG: iron-sulfur cluster assembly scaffold protein [Candidatus Roizmanbacteria bacterium CG03_land_8_20_14_0_80_35_26]PIZ68523.1 MAG: iron-sulfur cluster assembly scaffold protein [Candidatus Roizmanbacteria bacterium CG_4_10_14_0_2_um_filter_36_35]PJC31797.1 MAG: iron-sulfur cluster assembly scaffold protein [Candidatus Roizmanbacteria bacterium CG_4_9_14_0_